MDKFISCVVPDPSHWFFHFGKEVVIVWTHRVSMVDVPEPPLPAAQEIRRSSRGVTPCIVMKNGGFIYHQILSFYPESMRLRFLRQSEGTTARDPVQHKR